MKHLLTTLLLLTATYGYTEDKKPSFAEEAFTKAIEANCKEASKNYEIYVKSLEVANQKIIKALEVTKSDLSDTKKFTKLTISDRADAIKEVDKKIAEIKKGSLGEIVARRSDLLGDGSEVDIKKMIVGKWKKIKTDEKFIFGTNKTATIISADGVVMSKGHWSYENGKFVVLWERYGKEIIVYTQDNKKIASETYGWIGNIMDE